MFVKERGVKAVKVNRGAVRKEAGYVPFAIHVGGEDVNVRDVAQHEFHETVHHILGEREKACVRAEPPYLLVAEHRHGVALDKGPFVGHAPFALHQAGHYVGQLYRAELAGGKPSALLERLPYAAVHEIVAFGIEILHAAVVDSPVLRIAEEAHVALARAFQ